MQSNVRSPAGHHEHEIVRGGAGSTQAFLAGEGGAHSVCWRKHICVTVGPGHCLVAVATNHLFLASCSVHCR